MHIIQNRASLIAQLVKNLPAVQETLVPFLGQEDPLEKNRLPRLVFLGFPGGSACRESTCSAGDPGSILGLGRSPGEGKGYPLQYSGLENCLDYTVHGVTGSQTRLSDFHFHLFKTGPYLGCLQTSLDCVVGLPWWLKR